MNYIIFTSHQDFCLLTITISDCDIRKHNTISYKLYSYLMKIFFNKTFAINGLDL